MNDDEILDAIIEPVVPEPVVDPLPVLDPVPVPEVVADPSVVELLQQMSDLLAWNVAIQMLVVCLLFFVLFFGAVQAGKN